MEDSKANKFIVPIAIILAGITVAGAIFYNKKTPSPATPEKTGEEQQANVAASPLDNFNPVSEQDHFLGNPDAPVVSVLYTDLVCPFCKRFHLTMKQIMDEYGKAGKLKWIIRPFPLEQLHPNAKNEAIAAECAAELGGNEKFFEYIDRVFETGPAEGFDAAGLLKLAGDIGLNSAQFKQCLTGGKFDQYIKNSIEDAIKTGAQGTPYSILIGPNGKKSVIPGALPLEDVKKAIDEMLETMK